MKLKHYPMLLIPACLITFVFRALELILYIDPRSGYFTVGAIMPSIFNVFLILVALLFASVLFTKPPRSEAQTFCNSSSPWEVPHF